MSYLVFKVLTLRHVETAASNKTFFRLGSLGLLLLPLALISFKFVFQSKTRKVMNQQRRKLPVDCQSQGGQTDLSLRGPVPPPPHSPLPRVSPHLLRRNVPYCRLLNV